MRIMHVVLGILIVVTTFGTHADQSADADECELGCNHYNSKLAWRSSGGPDVIWTYDAVTAEVAWSVGPGGVRQMVVVSYVPLIPAFVNRFDCGAQPICDPRQLPEEMREPVNPMNMQAVVKYKCMTDAG